LHKIQAYLSNQTRLSGKMESWTISSTVASGNFGFCTRIALLDSVAS